MLEVCVCVPHTHKESPKGLKALSFNHGNKGGQHGGGEGGNTHDLSLIRTQTRQTH